MRNDEGLAVFTVLVWAYMLAAHIFMLYFWYQWSQTHGFLSTLFIGPIVSEIKGLLFPFFM